MLNLIFHICDIVYGESYECGSSGKEEEKEDKRDDFAR